MSFLDHLKRFNRKERFILLDYALKGRPFQLSSEFRKKLSSEIELEIPQDAYVAMDFHLDWIAVALRLHELERPIENDGIVVGNQQDVDLFVAFDRAEITYLVLVEAKAQMSWLNSQLREKADRLREIFSGSNESEIRPYFALTSPRRPMKVETVDWPNWMRKDHETPYWIELPMCDQLIQPTRCTPCGKPDKDGKYVKLRK